MNTYSDTERIEKRRDREHQEKQSHIDHYREIVAQANRELNLMGDTQYVLSTAR